MESESMLCFVAAVMGLVVALVALLLLRRRSSPQPQLQHHQDQVPVVNLPARQPINRRMRRRTVASTSASALNSEDEDNEEVPEADYYVSKSSKKKEIKRQEREARRQAEQAAHEVQGMKHNRYAEMRRQKDEEREAEEHRKEEAAQAQKAKEEEATNAEFERWKDAFSVDTEGTAEEEMQHGGQGLLFDFVEYIKKHKCVLLEDLAAEFKLRTQDCINRIFALEKMGRLYGVMDDRGKYIYISLEEMKAVADYIKRQGRVSIAHLASKSNEFISLEPELDLDTVSTELNEDYNVNSGSNAIAVA